MSAWIEFDASSLFQICLGQGWKKKILEKFKEKEKKQNKKNIG